MNSWCKAAVLRILSSPSLLVTLLIFTMALLHSFAPLTRLITSHTHTKVLVKKFKTEKVLESFDLCHFVEYIGSLQHPTVTGGDRGKRKNREGKAMRCKGEENPLPGQGTEAVISAQLPAEMQPDLLQRS